jgi:hypothetical protein
VKSVDVLLINPPQNAELKTLLELHGPPMASMYLAAYVRKMGYNPKILDMDLKNFSFEDALKYVESTSPKILGEVLSTYFNASSKEKFFKSISSIFGL